MVQDRHKPPMRKNEKEDLQIMSRIVFKYKIDISGFQLDLPEGAKILKIDLQAGVPQMWIMFDENKRTRPSKFSVYGTGHEIRPESVLHVGTFQQEGFVWHVFRDID